MKTPVSLTLAFQTDFETQIADFCIQNKWIEDASQLQSQRFLSRSIIPHVKKLSELFNRLHSDEQSLDPYWKNSSNLHNLRLAYFLYFMPCNLYRMACVWNELHHLGYRWEQSAPDFRMIDWGAGPGSSHSGILASEALFPIGIPSQGHCALIEQDLATLKVGESWLQSYQQQFLKNYEIKGFHRKFLIESFDKKNSSRANSRHSSRPSSTDSGPPLTLLPRNAPQFSVWTSSFFLNELSLDSQKLSNLLYQTWNRHLADESLIIMIEPALKQQSRQLLELRQNLITHFKKTTDSESHYKILTPCLGEQSCGALAKAEDWCHEEVTWWRPSWIKKIDALAELDRKKLSFSYLVIAKSKKSRTELLPNLKIKNPPSTLSGEAQRLVSPSHWEGQKQEFFICGQDGKKRARLTSNSDKVLERGDVILGAQFKPQSNPPMIERYEKLLTIENPETES